MRFMRFLPCLLFLLTACGTPDFIQLPVTPGPISATGTPALAAGINAPVVESPSLALLYMLDERDGWGITDTQVVRTDDGAVTWYDVTPSGLSTQLGYNVKPFFLDTRSGWILLPEADYRRGTLYHTSDGGLDWQAESVPFGGGELTFLDKSNGWIMADLGAGAGSNAVAIYQSSDAGRTWTQNYINDPTQAGASNSLPLGGLKNGLTPVDMQSAWIGGVTYAPGVVYLYQTQDGGHSWSLQPVPIPGGYDQGEFQTPGPQFITAQDAYLPVHISTQNGVMLAVYASHDGGANWALTPTLIPTGGSMDFVSRNDGFVWNSTAFYVTHDGAKTWTIVPPDAAFGDNFAGMDFVSAAAGLVLTNDVTGARGLYKTTDGGATWTSMAR